MRWRKSTPAGTTQFRAAITQFLKGELAEAREAAQAQLLKDRHGRRCAERLCDLHDQIIGLLFDAATQHLYKSRCRPTPSAWRSSPPAATAAA